MKTDVQIAQETNLLPIQAIADKLGLRSEEILPYGHDKAKINLEALDKRENQEDGKLILVTAINPTPAGEGKTTTNVGLSMALNKLGYKAITTLREPSLGPCFGIKGGAAGGGYAQVLPMEDINLHFTGDFHAITSAHNLLAAMVDNSLHQGNPLNMDPKRIVWNRVLDMNDRALRNIVIGMGKRGDGVVRESSFDITVASEIMAILCLANDMEDLKDRLGRMVVAYTYDNKEVVAKDLGAVGAMALLLKDAIKPNLVQTTENTPALIHGGPFANIAHGCNSVLATKMGLKLADYCVTEAGFGADLGAEKFLDIVCPQADLKPDAIVLVATIRALKMNGGVAKDDLDHEDLEALDKGLANLLQHIENLQKYGVGLVVAINRFPTDTEAEIELLRDKVSESGIEIVLSEVFAKGGEGGLDLARAVVDLCNKPSHYLALYRPDMTLRQKMNTVAKEIYRAGDVVYQKGVISKLKKFERMGAGNLPICVAKTQYSFSDDPKKLGAPKDFALTVRDVKISAGAGFVVFLTGEIMTMPGLPKDPQAVHMDILEDGTIIGLS